MKARVDRLVRDEFRPEDISRLFLYLRARSRGRETVTEIGDFFAHMDERYKGISTVCVRDFFTLFEFIAISKKYRPLNFYNLPPNIADILSASLRRTDDAALQAGTGLKLKAAHKMLPQIIRQLVPNKSGGMKATRIFSVTDRNLIEFLCSRAQAVAAFTEERLVSEFCDALIDDGLLTAADKPKMLARRDMISLSAVVSMHQTSVELGGGRTAVLLGTREIGPPGKIGVVTQAKIDIEIKGNIYLAGPVYVTSLDASKYLDASLLDAAEKSPILGYSLELSAAGKLVRLD